MEYIKIENLNVIFGSKKEKEEALKLIDTNKTIEEIKKITKATIASRNLNFSIKKNEMLVIVGLSGSGKSSFVRTLNLLNKPTSGNIYVNNKNITSFNKEELREYRRKEISMVFQAFGLLNHRNILDNVSYPLEIQNIDKKTREIKAKEAIELVGLKGWEYNYPHELSGGMQQRVGLARALANEPNIILLDEPFSALDPLIRKEMQDDLLTLADKTDRTTIFITHDMTEAFKLGDRVVLMKDGEIVQIGTPKEFFRNPKNEYVKQFLEDVDKTKILRVRNIMRKIDNLVMINDSLIDVFKHMEDKEIEDLFVTDDQGVLLGYVNKKLVKNNLDKKLTNLNLKKITHYVSRNTYLTDVFNDLNDSDIEVPVLDSKGRLRGVIGYSDVIDALSD